MHGLLELDSWSGNIMIKHQSIPCLLGLLLLFTTGIHAKESERPISKAYFAGGCFWGVEYFFERQDGVVDVISGYMGGESEYPTYMEVSYTHTNHVELVEVQYDHSKVDYETLARLFFETHDPTQTGGQGPDVGDQYSSVIFYSNESEKEISEKLIKLLEVKGFEIATQLRSVMPFWEAEEDHQDYYSRKGGTPYCHGYTERF
jgi:peptide methionine sulfoxide reductase msrA/msrB